MMNVGAIPVLLDVSLKDKPCYMFKKYFDAAEKLWYENKLKLIHFEQHKMHD